MSTLLVASSGGHLMELVTLAPRLDAPPPLVWLTNDTVMARSVLDGADVVWRPAVGSRDARRAGVEAVRAAAFFRVRRFGRVVSTGGPLALAYLPAARLFGIRTSYIESAARVDGLSLTGRLLRFTPGVEVRTQTAISSRLEQIPSVFSGFAITGGERRPVRRALVLLGTERFSFRRLLVRLVDVLGDDVDVVWQTGTTPTAGLSLAPTPWLKFGDVVDAARAADVVITHAGVGSVLTALLAGKCPVVIPRDPRYGEHVDAHQLATSRELRRCSLALVSGVDYLDRRVLELAASCRAVRLAAAELLPSAMSNNSSHKVPT